MQCSVKMNCPIVRIHQGFQDIPIPHVSVHKEAKHLGLGSMLEPSSERSFGFFVLTAIEFCIHLLQEISETFNK